LRAAYQIFPSNLAFLCVRERFIDLTLRNCSAATLILAKQPGNKYSLVLLVAMTLAYRPAIPVGGPVVELDKAVEGFVDVVAVEAARGIDES
jgi:hypothetical protein